MKKISLLFARTAELWWDGLDRLIKELDQFQIVGTCRNGSDIIREANILKPDIILLDEQLSGGDCVEVAQNMNKISPETNIIIIARPYKYENTDVNAIFKTRAKAYIDKDITFAELIEAIENVARGGMVVISPKVASKMLEYLDHAAKDEETTRHEFDISLSKREKSILAMVASKGASNREIAEAMFIPENTVKSHLANIMYKMNVSSRQQAAALAREIGIVPYLKE